MFVILDVFMAREPLRNRWRLFCIPLSVKHQVKPAPPPHHQSDGDAIEVFQDPLDHQHPTLGPIHVKPTFVTSLKYLRHQRSSRRPRTCSGHIHMRHANAKRGDSRGRAADHASSSSPPTLLLSCCSSMHPHAPTRDSQWRHARVNRQWPPFPPRDK